MTVRALTGDRHGAAKYLLTGPQSLSQVERVSTIGKVIGRPLRYDEISPEAARQQLLTRFPPPVVDGVLNVWAKFMTEPEPVLPTVEEVAGAPARTDPAPLLPSIIARVGCGCGP